MSLLELVLNTPERYWVIINGWHLHKGGIGIILQIIGMLVLFFDDKLNYVNDKKRIYRKIGFTLFIIGTSLILLKYVSHFYLGRPELCWDFKAMFWEKIR